MARIDEKKDSPSNVLHNDPKQNGDPLFNFLAGAVTGHSGLGPSSAGNAGAKTDSIRRLQETLNVQFGDLRKSHKQDGSMRSSRDGQLSNPHAEMLSFTERLSWLESAAHQTRQMRESLRKEMDSLQIQLSERKTRDSVVGSLEETLSSQIHELQNLQSTGGLRGEIPLPDATNLGAQLQACADRIGKLEAIISQAHQSRETLRVEIAALQAQVTRKHDELDAWHSTLDRVGENVMARLEALEHDVKDNHRETDSEYEKLIQFHTTLRELGERIGQIEIAAQQAKAADGADGQRAREIAIRISAELASLKEQFGEQQQALQPLKSDLAGMADAMSAEIHGLRQRIEEKTTSVNQCNAALKEVEARLQSIAQRVQSTESVNHRVDSLADLASRTEDQIKEIQGSFDDQVRELRSGQTSLREGYDNQQHALEQINRTMASLTDRLATFDAVADHADRSVASFQAELNALKGELAEQQRNSQAVDNAARESQEQLRGKITEIFDLWAKSQNERETREHQLREDLMAELTALRTQFHEGQERFETQQSNLSGFEESLTAKMQRFEDQLKENLHAVTSDTSAQFHAALTAVTERMDHVESVAREEQAIASGQAQHAELVKAEYNAELAALKANLDQEQIDRRRVEELSRNIEQALTGKIQELQQRIEEISAVGSDRHDAVAALKPELQALTEKISALEPVAQKLNALEAREVENEHGQRNMNESLNAKIFGLEGQLNERMQTVAANVGAIDPLKSELEALMIRFAKLQATAEQALSLAGGNARTIAEDMAAVKAEIDGIKSSPSQAVTDGAAMNSRLQNLEETLNQKFQKLEAQMGQKLHLVGSRDFEVNALKAEMAALSGRIAEVAGTIQALNKGSVDTAAPTAAARSEAGLSLIRTPERAVTSSQQNDRRPLETTDQVKQLQDRMSAEIERVRAELREKSGRWKVRK